MRYHILNGDDLAKKFPVENIPGQIIVIREAFIEGPVSTEFSNEYWERRAAFIYSAYGAQPEDYAHQFLSQLQLMDSITPDDEICLWFEDDLFCQTNMWFAIFYLSPKVKARFFRILPNEDKLHWTGFGKSDEHELMIRFEGRKEFSDDDIKLSNRLWEAYVMNDQHSLQLLSFSETECFRFLPEVIQAHLDRATDHGRISRPQQTLRNILNEETSNFYEICDEFWKREGIYGFGDLQVYNMLKEMEIEFTGGLI